MIQELINKYKIDEKYTTYLEKFSNDLYLMDINAYVLSKIDKDIEIYFVDYEIGSVGVSMGINMKLLKLDFKRLLIDELLNTISLITKRNNNILFVNKIVSNIGIHQPNDDYDPNPTLVRFEDFDINSITDDSYSMFLKSDITNDPNIIKENESRD